MQPRAKKRANPRKSPEVQGVPAVPYTFPAPIMGLVLDQNLALAQPGGAVVLDNWVVTTTGIRLRGGRVLYATVDDPVKSMFTYRAASDMLFAATATDIYDVSNVVDAEVAPTAAVASQTSGDWSTVQFGTAGGEFLYAVNGVNSAQLFNGSTWAAVTGVSTPAITGVATTALSHVWTFGNRVWFVESGTMSAWYLPVDAIGGAATEFILAGLFTKGGSLLFGGTWSMDAGDGLDDKCVFVSSEGEVVVYEGTNPASSSTWRLAGRYDFPRPLGKSAVVNAGGDLLIATESGMIPISAAISSDIGAIDTKAVSARIRPMWRTLVALRPNDWIARKFNRAGYMLVSSRNGDNCLVVNMTNGGWSRFTGWDVVAMLEFEGRGYCGGADGRVYRFDESGEDYGAVYTSVYVGQHESLGAPGVEKTWTQARATFRFSTAFTARISATTDFSTAVGAPPSAVFSTSTDLWDVGAWDAAIWDSDAGAVSTRSPWSAIGLTGDYLAPVVQITSGGTVAPLVELVSIDAMYHSGGVVV